MSCGCKTSGDSAHSCGTKSANGCESVNTCGNSYKLSVFDWLSNVQNPASNRCDFVEVRFKNDRKLFYKNVNNIPLHIGSVVTVESSPGHDVGVVSLTGELVKIQMKKKRFSEDGVPKIYRLANQKDIEVWQEAMLIKEFAGTFRTKIDMKQIGFRQEAAKVGGIGSCGRELCCSTWLTDFRSVNTNVARYQQLSINPQKLAGQCGKLKCCLNYELDSYLDALSDFPSSSTTLDTEKGRAFCIKIDVFKKKMWFAYVDSSMAWYDFDVALVKKMIAKNKKGEKTLPLEELKQPDFAVQTVDLIQENSVDRFEKKNRGSNKNRNQNKPNNNNGSRRNRNETGDKNVRSEKFDKDDKPLRTERPSKPNLPPNNNNSKSPKQQQKPPMVKVESAVSDSDNKPQNQPPKKKFKKKFPPKKDNNA